MRIPESLSTLAEYGIISEVERSLMSGKEAEVYLVIAGGERRVAKIYKEAQNRTFKHRADYTEGRKVRNTRDQRAIGKRTAHGRAQDESAWRATEVNMIYRLQAAGVRVPAPHVFIDGVLVMELVVDDSGHPAPRLGDVSLDRAEAYAIYQRLIGEVVRMLSSGVVHGDLSDFNVLLGADGPVIIDFPQSVDPAHNPNARKLLLRDVNNLHDFLARHDRAAPRLPYAEEMWDLYQSNRLAPDTVLTGKYRAAGGQRADTDAVMRLIDDAKRDERRRRDALGLKGGPQEQPRGPRPPQPGGRPQGPPQQARAPRPQQPGQPPRPQHAPRPQHDRPRHDRPQHDRPQHDRPQQSHAPRPAAQAHAPRPQQLPRPQQQPRPQHAPHTDRPAAHPTNRPPGPDAPLAASRRSRRRHRGSRPGGPPPKPTT